jgi:hypothetical protein
MNTINSLLVANLDPNTGSMRAYCRLISLQLQKNSCDNKQVPATIGDRSMCTSWCNEVEVQAFHVQVDMES